MENKRQGKEAGLQIRFIKEQIKDTKKKGLKPDVLLISMENYNELLKVEDLVQPTYYGYSILGLDCVLNSMTSHDCTVCCSYTELN